MTTTELIELLKSVEFGTSGRPREISISSEGMFWPNPKLDIGRDCWSRINTGYYRGGLGR